MKNKILIILLVFFLSFCFFVLFKSLESSSIYVPEKKEDRQLVEFVSEDLFTKKKIILSEIFQDSDYYILNIWASWCAPCRKEHPQLMELSKNSSIKLIGLNYKDDPKKAKKFLKKLGNPFSIIITDQNGTLSIEFGGYGIPETFLINKDKKIIKTFIGNLSNESVRQINSIAK
jgi:cytochrome c biogenesis protein CcmG/thiol:disulfide interchange protein DsbE